MARGKNPRLATDYDIVVIGSGCGGLVAGCRLAQGGAKVIILEQHNLPGGFASSFVRGRFEFEAALHALADYGTPENPGSVRKLFSELGVEIPFAFLPDAYHLICTEDKVDEVLRTGTKVYIDDMDRIVPGYRDELTRYFALCDEVLDALNYIEAHMDKLDKVYLLTHFPNFIRTSSYTVEEVTNKCFKFPEELLSVLYSYWGYLGVPTNELNFTIWAAMISMLHDKMNYIPLHRSHEMSLALVERFESLGGRIEYNTRVEKILVEDGEARGVETNHGDKISAKRIVANTSPHVVYKDLIHPKSEVPEIARRYCNSRQMGITLVSVFLGLNASAESLGIKDYEYFIHESMAKERRYKVPSKPELTNRVIVSCINAIVPDASPPGTCILSISLSYEAGVWDSVSQEGYFALKESLAEQLIEKVERGLGIRLREHIEEIEISTPTTLASYTSHYKGTVYGYKTNVWDSLIPRNLCVDEELYIKNLDFVGGFSFRGMSYPSSYVSGKIVADKIIAIMGKAEKEAVK